MQTINLQVKASDDGRLIIDVPAPPNQAFEVVLVLQPVENGSNGQATQSEEVDEMGYPIGFFERIYGSFADEPLDETVYFPPPKYDDVE